MQEVLEVAIHVASCAVGEAREEHQNSTGLALGEGSNIGAGIRWLDKRAVNGLAVLPEGL